MKNASIAAMIVGIIGIAASIFQIVGGEPYKDQFGQLFISFTLFGYALIHYKGWENKNSDE